MPRKSRIDAPGALHHVIARGINRQQIFLDDADRKRFLDRLGNLLCEFQTDCYAWTDVCLKTAPREAALRGVCEKRNRHGQPAGADRRRVDSQFGGMVSGESEGDGRGLSKG
jgi:hypothetical protein